MAELESNGNELGFVINVKLDELKKQLKEYDTRLIQMEQNTEKATDNMSGMFDKLGKLVGAYMSAGMIKSFVQQIINVRGQFQQLEIAFSTMLGSQEKANALMKELTETAAKTPFDMTSIAQGAKQLLAYGTASEEVNDTLVRLGNIASGLSIPLNDLVNLYGTTQVQGRVFTQDIRQFLGRGIPIVKELAKQFGVAESEVGDLVSKGEVGFEHIRKALEAMTDQGGMFFNLMEKQSASLAGQVSNLEDAFTNMLNEIGRDWQDTLSSGISAVSVLVENYRKIGMAVVTLAEAYGIAKTALIINNSLEAKALVIGQKALTLTKLRTKAELALQAVMKMNPYVLLGAGIATAVLAIYNYSKATDETSEAQKRLNRELETSNKRIEDNQKKVADSISVIRDKTKSIYEQIDAYKELQKQEGSFKGVSMEEIQSMSTEDIEKKTKYNEIQQRKDEAERIVANVKTNLEYTKREIERYEKDRSVKTQQQTDEYRKNIKKREALLGELSLAEEQYRKNEEEHWKASNQAMLEGKNNAEKTKLINEQNKQIEGEMAEIRKRMSSFGSIFSKEDIQRLETLQNRLNQNIDVLLKLEEQQKKEAKDYAYWQKQKEEAVKRFHETLPENTKEFEEAKKAIAEAEKQLAKWDLKLQKTKDNIAEIIQKWKDLAQKSNEETSLLNLSEFDRMKADNQNAYNDKIRELERQRDKDIKANGITADAINKINASYQTLADNAKKAFEITNEAIKEEERNYLTDLSYKLSEYYSTELERELHDIEKDAERTLKEVEDKFGKNSKRYKDAKAKVNEQKESKKEDAEVQSKIKAEQRLSDLRVQQLELTKMLRGEQETELEILREKEASIAKQIKYLEDQKHAMTEAEKVQLEELKAMLQKLGIDIKTFERKIRDMRSLMSEMFGSVGGSMSSSNNATMANIGSFFNQISSAMATSKSITDKLEAGQKREAYGQAISSSVSGTIDMFNLIYDQVQANKQALEEWDNAVRDSAHKLKLIELEELNWKDTNIWGVANPYDKLQKSLDKTNKASMMASESLKKLGEGRVKTGTEKKLDAKTTLQATGIGMSIGTAIGALFGPWGALIGAGAGAITGMVAGMIGGRKEVDVYDSLRNQYGELYDKNTLEINKKILADYDKMDNATKKLIDETKELLAVQKEELEAFEELMAQLAGDIGQGLSDSLVNAFTNGNTYQAVDDFKSYIQQQIESVIQQKVFASVFQPTIDSLSSQLKNGIVNADGQIVGNIEDKLGEFPARIKDLMGTYDYLMTSYQELFKKGGYDLFKAQQEATQEALQGTISSMSEDTATKLNGNFMGLKLSAMEINQNVGTMRNLATEANDMMKSSLETMNRIADNTAFCAKLQRLDELADDLSDMKRNGILVR